MVSKMNEIIIRPVVSKKDEKIFLLFPYKVIYKDDKNWATPLYQDRKKLIDKNKNPFYKHADAEFYIAEKNGVIVGRIGAIVNFNHNKEHNDKIGFFGFFECINDQQVANKLFDKAKEFLLARGLTQMRGPANPSVNDEYGLLINAFDKPAVVMMTYNPDYYLSLIENYGFKKEKDLFAYLIKKETVFTEKFLRVSKLLKKRNSVSIRTMEMKNFNNEVEEIKKIYNIAWAKNWGAIPMTEDEINLMAKDLKPIVVPELVLFAERNGKTIGFSLSIPDVNIALKFNKSGNLLTGLYHLLTKKKKIDLVRVVVLGVLPEYQTSGVAALLFYESAQNAMKLGYNFGEASWILEDNLMMNRAAEALKGERYKTYRIYQMDI